MRNEESEVHRAAAYLERDFSSPTRGAVIVTVHPSHVAVRFANGDVQLYEPARFVESCKALAAKHGDATTF